MSEEKQGSELFDKFNEREKTILLAQSGQRHENPKNFSYFSLYRYSTWLDIILIVIGCLGAMAAGAALPLTVVLFGQVTKSFADLSVSPNESSKFLAQVSAFVIQFVYLFVGVLFSSAIMVFCFTLSGQRQSRRIRTLYLSAILRQNIGYFDVLGSGEITTRLTVAMNEIEHGMSESVGLSIKAVATFVSAFIIAYIKTWKLSLIMTSLLVAFIGSIGFFSTKTEKYLHLQSEQVNLGNSIAEEVISSIRNVQAFGMRKGMTDLYDKYLLQGEKLSLKVSIFFSLMLGSIFFVLYCLYSLALWEGSRMLGNEQVNIAQLFTAIFAVVIASFSLSSITVHIKAFAAATSSGRKIFDTISLNSSIDIQSASGRILNEFRGKVELKNIKFVYPARPSITVTKSLSLDLEAGQVLGLVGPSGSGKSTIIGLVERFYDPIGGQILIDDVPITDLNLKWLRSQIALVGQEPVLFATSILENILYGLTGTEYEKLDHSEKLAMAKQACIEANAHDFICKLQEGYETIVGERGSLLSGGQKQRIAIARAIIKKPKILLLDEATSALDTKSEGIVQAALEKASKNRTTIVVAHRLSTIKNSNKIVFLVNGEIKEQGTHNELLEKKGY